MEDNKNINLSEEEISVLENYVKNGEDFVNVEDEHLQSVYMGLIDKAEKLEEDLDAYDEVCDMPSGDLLLWFHKKYKGEA